MVKTFRESGWFRQSVVAVIALNIVACGSFFLDDQELVRNARGYLEKREINAAAIELRNALQKNPGNAEARYLLGRINLDFGDFAAAEKEFRRSIEAGGDDELVLLEMARALLAQQRYTQLLNDIEVKESYSVTSRANIFGLRAIAETGMGNTDRAWMLVAEGTSLAPDAVEIMKATILLQHLDGRQTEVRKTLAHALKRYPDKADILIINAGFALQDEDNVTAESLYRQVMDADPPGFISFYGRIARFRLVELNILAGDLAQAEAMLRPLTVRNPGEPRTRYLRGLLAMLQGDYDLAEQRMLKLLELVPEHTATRLLLGTINFAQQDYEQAVYFLAKYLSAVPDNIAARKLLGRGYLLLGQNDAALELLQPAINEQTGDAELLALVSLSELRKGDIEAGVATLERAVATDPESIALRGALARAYLATGDTGLAVRVLKDILGKHDDQQQVETLLILAYLSEGNFDLAINNALDILSRNPRDPAASAFAGNVFAASGNMQEARKYLEHALKVNPGFSPAILSLAYLEEQEGNTAKAEVLYKMLVDSEVRQDVPMLALARLAEKRGDKHGMVEWLKQAIVKAPDEVAPRVSLARYYLLENQLEKAGPLIDETIKQFRHEPETLELQGRLLLAERRFKEALSPLRDLIDRKSDSVAARVLLAECWMQLGRSKEARKELDAVLRQQGDNIAALALFVKLELRDGELDQALEYSKHLQREYPELYLGYQLEGAVRTARQEHEVGGEAYAQAWERRKSPELAVMRAENTTRTGDPAAAALQLEAWLSENPDDVRARQLLGVTYQGLGQYDKAAQVYEKVLLADSENLVALNNLAWLYMRSNNPDALALAERAYHSSPESPGVVDTYGWILVRQDQADKGLRLLEQAREKLPGVPEVSYHYAVALYKTGAREEARRMLEQLLSDGKSFEGREGAEQIMAELQ